MKLFDRFRDTSAEPENPQESERGLTRRTFLGAGAGAAVLLAGLTARKIYRAFATENVGPAVRLPPEVLRDKARLTLPQIRAALEKKYPELLQDTCPKYDRRQKTHQRPHSMARNFRALARDHQYESDELVQSYFHTASYSDLLEDRAVLPTDLVEDMTYLSPDRMWERKIEICVPNHKKDCEIAYEKCKPFRHGKMTLQKYFAVCKSAEERVKAKAKELGLTSLFLDAIDADFLIGISIHETMPTQYTNTARIGLFRTLLEEGMEVNKIPAIFDNVASFGVMQMTTMPYEGRSRAHGYASPGERGEIEPYLNDFSLPARLHDCVDLEDQLVAGMLLLLVNMSLFERALSSNQRFMDLWNDATLLHRRAFLSTILGTAHNNPRNSVRALQQAITWSRRDNADHWVQGGVNALEDLRVAYIRISYGGHRIAGRHGANTGDLVAKFSEYAIDSEFEAIAGVPELPGPSPTLPSSSVEIAPQRKIKMYVRKRAGRDYYTYTVPKWRLEYLTEKLCGSTDAHLIEDLKKFNAVARFNAGDVILIPVDRLRPELKNPELQEFSIPEGANISEFVLKLVGGDRDMANIALPYSATAPLDSVDQLNQGIVRLPKGVVKNGNGR